MESFVMKPDRIKTLLLVEDEVIIAMAKQNELKKYGYNVITANTGAKAVALAKANDSIDLVLMDIDLGNGIDGTAAAELILKEREVPIIFLSSHTEPEVVEKTENISFYGYVVKSSSITVLDASIKMAFKLYEANRRLAEEKNNLKIILNSIGDAVIATDINGKITRMNPAAEKITGWNVADALDQPLNQILNIINAETRLSVTNPVSKVLETGNIIGLGNHTILLSRNGTEHQILNSAAPIKDVEENIKGVILVFSDVSEQYKVDEKLRISAALFKKILHYSQDFIILMILWNPQYYA